ncbi:GTPase Era [Woodsholea maritima]|uniref:GTPase Era n=1 Tax=Woodsholea maritima TaxID=240237 RepID=UPI00036DF9C8|nr:GTPase Era [Woodsholea maritima]
MVTANNTPETRRAGFAAILGAPNAGKSTLVNALVGRKVSIVTHKVQTTRFQVRGVAMHGLAQLVLVDTPGVFAPRRRLDRAMVAAAWAGADDADVLVHVIDAAAEARVMAGEGKGQDKRASADVERVMDGLKATGRKAILALNKIDLLKRDTLLGLTQHFFESDVYDEVFMISAEKQDHVKDLADAIARRLPESEWLYPEDQIADLPERMLAAEITREKLYLRMHEELPYEMTVETESWQERKDGSIRIEQTIYVTRDNHKPMILGKGGTAIKVIGQQAREELERELGCDIHLFIHVKVRPGWGDERARFNALGLNFDA